MLIFEKDIRIFCAQLYHWLFIILVSCYFLRRCIAYWIYFQSPQVICSILYTSHRMEIFSTLKHFQRQNNIFFKYMQKKGGEGEKEKIFDWIGFRFRTNCFLPLGYSVFFFFVFFRKFRERCRSQDLNLSFWNWYYATKRIAFFFSFVLSTLHVRQQKIWIIIIRCTYILVTLTLTPKITFNIYMMNRFASILSVRF